MDNTSPWNILKYSIYFVDKILPQSIEDLGQDK